MTVQEVEKMTDAEVVAAMDNYVNNDEIFVTTPVEVGVALMKRGIEIVQADLRKDIERIKNATSQAE